MAQGPSVTSTVETGASDAAGYALIWRLGLVALGTLIASVGIASLFAIPDPTGVARVPAVPLIGIGSGVAVLGAWLALGFLRRLPPATSDCDQYGRHMIGLTYLLLLVGVSNGVGTSVLALEGGLGLESRTPRADASSLSPPLPLREPTNTYCSSFPQPLECAAASSTPSAITRAVPSRLARTSSCEGSISKVRQTP